MRKNLMYSAKMPKNFLWGGAVAAHAEHDGRNAAPFRRGTGTRQEVRRGAPI